MLAPCIPPDEPERLQSLQRLGILDSDPEERFDRITRIAREMFQVPIVLISLVDHSRQWFKSCIGLEVRETPRRFSFCAHAIAAWTPLVVADTLQDARFADNPLVTGPPHIRFYAGQPLRASDGQLLGTLCIIDRQPRELDAARQQQLRDLAIWVERELHLTELCHNGLIPPVADLPDPLERRSSPAATQSLTVLALEVEHFAIVAQNLGPVLEQRLRVIICRRLRHQLRAGDQVIALDDGRLRVLLQGGGPVRGVESWIHTAGVVERLQQVFAAPFRVDGQTLYLTVSITTIDYHDPQRLQRGPGTLA